MPDMFKMIDAAGAESAPFDGDTLVSYARQGVIQPATMIYDVSGGRWMPAGQHPLLGGGSPPPTPPPGGAAPPLGNYVPYIPNPQAQRSSAWTGITIVLIIFAVCIMGVIAIGAMKFLGSTASGVTPMQTVATDDGKYTISLPQSWTQWETEDKTVLEYMDSTSQGVVVLLQESDIPAVDQADMALLMKNVVKIKAKALNGTPIGAAQPTMVSEYHAYQQDIQGDGKEDIANFRCTLIGTPDGVYEIFTVGGKKSTEDRTIVDAAIKSFHKVAPGKPAPAAKA